MSVGRDLSSETGGTGSGRPDDSPNRGEGLIASVKKKKRRERMKGTLRPLRQKDYSSKKSRLGLNGRSPEHRGGD